MIGPSAAAGGWAARRDPEGKREGRFTGRGFSAVERQWPLLAPSAEAQARGLGASHGETRSREQQGAS
jgi:hypothetical protein